MIAGIHLGKSGQRGVFYAVCLTLFFVSGSMYALIPLRNYWGERITIYSARDLAFLGSSGPGSGASILFSRPGLMGALVRPNLELTYMANVVSEQRTRLVYDEFENTLGEAIFADNVTATGLPGPLVVSYPVLRGLVVGAGVAPIVDFQYRYKKEYRDNFYALVGEDRILQTGKLFLSGAGVSYRLGDLFALGASGGYVSGTRNLESWEIRIPDTAYWYESGKPEGVAYTGNIVVGISDRVQGSLAFSGPLRLYKWQTSPGSRIDVVLPWRVLADVAYRAAGKLPSRVLLEVGYSAWQYVDSNYAGVLDLRAGVEHTMLNFVKLRYGFGIEPSPFDPTIQRVGVGAGIGLDAGVCVLDFGAMFRREVVGVGLLRGEVTPEDQKVYQTGTVMGITVSRGF